MASLGTLEFIGYVLEAGEIPANYWNSRPKHPRKIAGLVRVCGAASTPLQR